MSKKAGVIILPKDLWNFKPRSSITETEAEKLQHVINKQIKIDGTQNFHYLQNEKGDEFYGYFIKIAV